jgi:hypothetical protein
MAKEREDINAWGWLKQRRMQRKGQRPGVFSETSEMNGQKLSWETSLLRERNVKNRVAVGPFQKDYLTSINDRNAVLKLKRQNLAAF